LIIANDKILIYKGFSNIIENAEAYVSAFKFLFIGEDEIWIY